MFALLVGGLYASGIFLMLRRNIVKLIIGLVLLGRLHGVPTPCNRALQLAANHMALRREQPGSVSLEELERDLIAQALRKTDGNRRAAAKLLGVTYDSLRYQIKKFGLE